jgi:predicted nucleic acid-binding protein
VRILLDADAYSFYMRGSREVEEIVEAAEEVMLSAVVVGELLYGFRLGSHFDSNVDRLYRFLDSPGVALIEVGQATADRYGQIAADLRARGRPIPTNDSWIAAHAMETGADLVSADAHFEHVDGLAWTRVTVG